MPDPFDDDPRGTNAAFGLFVGLWLSLLLWWLLLMLWSSLT